MTKHVDEVAREIALALGVHETDDLHEETVSGEYEYAAHEAMRVVVKQMRELAKRCASPADQLSIGDAAEVMLHHFVKEAGIDE